MASGQHEVSHSARECDNIICPKSISHLALTCLQLQMQLVRVDVERSREVQHNLEGLASADDELVAVELLGVVLLTVLTRL